jgi:uncharacterized protein YgbK (DUF1537 family)
VIYHKIDSTLRGNWVSELTHARRAVGELAGRPALAIVAPAFPSQGRTVRRGQVAVHGTPLADTEIWKEAGRMGAGDLPALLRRTGLNLHLLEIREVRQGRDALATAFRRLASSRIEAVACDAETDQDLVCIAQGLLSAGVAALWVGSAGLMRQLARALGKAPRNVPSHVQRSGPLLFVIGSASPVSHAQFERLIAAPGIAPIRIAPDTLSDERGAMAADDLARRLQSAIDAGKDVAVLVERGNAIDPSSSAGLLSMLASVTAPNLKRVGGLLATGGETARAILRAAGVAGIRLGGEVEPGVPWGTTLGATVLPVVTKAGAFGDSETLLRARHALKRLTAGQDTSGAANVQPAESAP